MNRQSNSNLRRSSQAGFTLVEIMVVVVILGLLGTLVAGNVLGSTDITTTTTVPGTAGPGMGVFAGVVLGEQVHFAAVPAIADHESNGALAQNPSPPIEVEGLGRTRGQFLENL